MLVELHYTCSSTNVPNESLITYPVHVHSTLPLPVLEVLGTWKVQIIRSG